MGVSSVGYGYLIELKYKAKILNKSKAIEFPIVFNDRVHGNSKIPKSTILKNLILVPKLKLDRFTKK